MQVQGQRHRRKIPGLHEESMRLMREARCAPSRAGRTASRFLKESDIVESRIQHLGHQRWKVQP
jgi:hypothetical protein